MFKYRKNVRFHNHRSDHTSSIQDKICRETNVHSAYRRCSRRSPNNNYFWLDLRTIIVAQASHMSASSPHVIVHVVISYTEGYRNLQQSYWTIQLSYRTRKFHLECSMSAPVWSSVHRNGTYPTLKTFLCFFNYRRFGDAEAPEGC